MQNIEAKINTLEIKIANLEAIIYKVLNNIKK